MCQPLTCNSSACHDFCLVFHSTQPKAPNFITACSANITPAYTSFDIGSSLSAARNHLATWISMESIAMSRGVLPITSKSSQNHLDRGITSSINKQASYGGHGTLEILKVTQLLEGNGIPCCLVGTSALIYYGADRARGDWHIAVTTDQMLHASSFLESYTNDYIRVAPCTIQPRSLTHIYPRFKCNGVNIFFQLLPSRDCHFECVPSKFVRSQKGLPYPKLDVYIQSLIDTYDKVALCDIVDGTNVTEHWGSENLDLSGTTDADWARWKNDAIRAQSSWNIFYLVETTVTSRRTVWEEIVRAKEKRLGFKHPKDLFTTRFRLHGSEDPWLRDRDAS